ncbi:FAD-containing monooxygenase EthA [Aquisphaera giovannonii]|uniref:FAD-containing monooxygenase EthA n=1 Tax=Aquisphaera giovannonii TaxID=406548 RepID=A0A5B9W5I4_9BACT|nr:NAD(P)/FAD-dependent oxidoreductase [Aquisphaera giovannonii]QEH35240.1 FAD-containing monooxygenase EthA [Aquisphaera giovannonii]
MSIEHFDVLVVGAGISGIAAGYYLQKLCPSRRYAILEGRGDLGGTWGLFRYPGARSDSDMFTLGYSFRPWEEPRSMAEAPAILDYLRETAREFGIDRRIRFRHRVRSASWSSESGRWTIEADAGEHPEPVRYTCDFLYLCSGYYDYERGYLPDFAGREEFRGLVVHPQHWPDGLDHRGKRVVVIGSGATAVTLVPALAEDAAHVVMLQRSPSYILSVPAEDRLARRIRRWLPGRAAHSLIRWKNILLTMYLYRLCRKKPERAKSLLRRGLARELPPDFDLDAHFRPRYEPWDQRLCFVPDGDLFRAIRSGRASVATGEVERFTRDGIRLAGGRELPADVIVTATGLNLLAWGGIRLVADGTVMEPGGCLTYKGVMLGNVPNCAGCAGYANASWTLRAELSAEYLCRLLNHMARRGYATCVPRCDLDASRGRPLLPLTSGYVRRGSDRLVKQGPEAPWVMHQNYVRDLLSLRWSRLDDGVLQFAAAGEPAAPGPSARPGG